MKLLQNPRRKMQKDGSIKEIYNQPERSKREDYFELCASCEQEFTPSDWQNDVCDKCLYKK